MIFRARTRHNRDLRLKDIDDDYFDKILDRIQVLKKKGSR